MRFSSIFVLEVRKQIVCDRDRDRGVEEILSHPQYHRTTVTVTITVILATKTKVKEETQHPHH